MPRLPLPAQALSALLLLSAGANAQLNTQLVASGLQFPVFVAAPPGDARLFIVQQGGIIKILKNGSVLPTPFLDIHTLTTVPAGNDERGLLGLCFAPDFATSGNFYVYYTNLSSGSKVRRYTVSANPDSADPASAHDVLLQSQPFSNHKGGTLAFGPDGYLYFGLGDGGSENDPSGNGQNTATLLSKMIRIDPNGDDFPADPLENYAIPPTNPFVGVVGVRPEIWAIGLRNPYRWSFDRLTGDLWIGDVGQNCWEEVDFEPAGSGGGRNYGWKITEGFHCFLQGGGCNPTGCDMTGLTPPIREYSHSQDGFSCSITGGSIYRGNAMPNLQGTYFYADFCSAHIYSLRYDGVNVTDLTDRTADLAPGGGFSIGAPVAIGEDGFGELYIVDRNSVNGEVYKIIPDPAISGVQPTAPAAGSFALGTPAPNPFRARTSFELRLDAATTVNVAVHDAAGRLVRSIFHGAGAAGSRSLEWDGRDASGAPVAAGVYFLRAEAGGHVSTQRIIRVR